MQVITTETIGLMCSTIIKAASKGKTHALKIRFLAKQWKMPNRQSFKCKQRNQSSHLRRLRLQYMQLEVFATNEVFAKILQRRSFSR